MPSVTTDPACRQVQLLLREAEVPFVIVGSTAHLLRGAPVIPKDLDVITAQEDVQTTKAALARSRQPSDRTWVQTAAVPSVY